MPSFACGGQECDFCQAIRREGWLEAMQWVKDTMVKNISLSKLDDAIYRQHGVNIQDAVDLELALLRKEKNVKS